MRFFLTITLAFCVFAGAKGQDTLYWEDGEVVETVDETAPMVDADEEYEFEEFEDEPEHTLTDPAELSSTKSYQSESFRQPLDKNSWREIVGETNYIQKRKEQQKDWTPSLPWAGPLLQALGYGIIIAAIVFILWIVFKNVRFVRKPAPSGIAPFTSTDSDDIHELDLPTLLRQALAEKNFRLAVRFYYLTLLKNLNDAGVIRWEKDKTNREYLYELFAREFHYDEISKLTRSYEEVWFSDHAIGNESLEAIINRFETLQARINPVKTP